MMSATKFTHKRRAIMSNKYPEKRDGNITKQKINMCNWSEYAIRASTLTKALPWLNVSCLYAVTLLWFRMAAGYLPFVVAGWLFSLLLISLLLGDLFQKHALKDNEKFNNLPTKLLTGLLCTNILLLIISLILPLHLTTDWLFLSILVLILWFHARHKNFNRLLPIGHLSETFFFLIIPLAITAWCYDLLRPIELKNGVEIIRAWQDIYYHICQISTFASSKGFKTLSDVQMAGAAVHPYHFASYLLPAVLVDVTRSSALVAYESILVPLGILTAALAAYSLSSIIFGKWPALAASLALMLLPDTSQQGFGNPFFSYHWLQQIAPAQSYGVASAALVFMLMMEGCRITSYRLIVWGYVFVFVTLLYKSQIFVAISFFAFIFPALFMKERIAKYRVFWLLLLTCIYFGIVTLSQTNPHVPIIRLDGTDLTSYSLSILNMQTEGFIKKTFTYFFIHSGNNWYLKAASFVLVLTICTFGVFLIIYILLLKHMKRYFKPDQWLFPLIVVTIYLVMGSCLALDTRHIGTPEELLHRPFVWAYFVLVVWCAGATYHRLFGDALPANRKVSCSLVLLIFSLVPFPFIYGKGIQTMEIWGVGYQFLPVCQVNPT